MSHAASEPQIPRLPTWSCGGPTSQRVALSGFLIAATMERADQISMHLHEYLTACRRAPGCLRAEIWRSRSDPMRFAVFLRFRSRADYDSHAERSKECAWSRAVAPIAGNLRLHPE